MKYLLLILLNFSLCFAGSSDHLQVQVRKLLDLESFIRVDFMELEQPYILSKNSSDFQKCLLLLSSSLKKERGVEVEIAIDRNELIKCQY